MFTHNHEPLKEIKMLYTDLNTEIDVGSSGHLVEFGSFKVLVDCGLHPKNLGLSALPNLSKIEPETLDFIAITHSHLDHCGGLPVIARTQHSAHILTADENCELLLRMLRNSRHVMGKQREEFNIKEYPLFEYSAIDELKSRITPAAFFHTRRYEIGQDSVDITFYPSGHIPGASSIMFEYKKRKTLFTGDISFHSTGILKGANIPCGKLDTLVVETTRGSYERPEGSTYETERERFISSMARVLRDGGSVLIPAFALGRMQEILHIINHAKRQGRISRSTPVFAGGLGLDIAEYFVKAGKRSSTFTFSKQQMEGVQPLRAEMVAGKDFDEKGIYILGSGMMVQNTPSYFAAASMMDNHQNAIFFVGYSDPDTPAYKMLHTFAGDSFAFRDLFYVGTLNCRIDKFDLTSHADRNQIMEFILDKDPRCVVLTHGSMESREWFMDEIIDRSPKTAVIIPSPSESIDL